MRKPSPRCLPNTVTVYRLVTDRSAYDPDGGLVPDSAYSATPAYSAEPCQVQYDRPARDELGQMRVSTALQGAVLFTRDLGLLVNDRLDWTDDAGTVRKLFVDGRRNQAGRGCAFTVPFSERL